MKLQVLVGMIASGKSTYSKIAAKNGSICMNDDSIVNMLHGDDYTLYDKSLKILYKSIENHIISTALSMNKVVVVDRGLNISIEGRKRWIALGKSFDVPVEAIIFENSGPLVHAERRINSDARGHSREYWYNVAVTHNKQWEEPSLAEGFNLIHYASFEAIKAGKVF